MQQGSGESSLLIQMAEMLLVCERHIPIHQQRLDSANTNYHHAFDSAKSQAQHTIQLQEKLGKLKGELRESEVALVKALSVKTRKEAKRMATLESISLVRARVQELKGDVEDQREKKDHYAPLMSKQYEDLTAYKEKYDQKTEHIKQIEEAISCYNRVLGFRVEPGHVLSCNPHLTGTKELVVELNKSNGLYKFVRTMREKFQQAAAQGISARSSFSDEASLIISLSAPVASVSTDPGYTSPPENLQSTKSNSNSKKVGGHTTQSPRSASSSVRRSSRLKG